jgi:hypothetical protein
MNRAKQAIRTAFHCIFRPDRGERHLLTWIILALLLVTAVAANDLPSAGLAQSSQIPPTTSAALATKPVPTPTARLATPEQNETDGMIIGGVVLVLIIIGGTLQVLRPRSNE